MINFMNCFGGFFNVLGWYDLEYVMIDIKMYVDLFIDLVDRILC